MGLDSVELLIEIENHFKIEIPNLEAEKIQTVGDIYEAIQRKRLMDGVSDEDVYLTLKEIISSFTDIPIDEIKSHHSITRDLGID